MSPKGYTRSCCTNTSVPASGTGDYTVTPGESEIVLETRHLRMTDNVTISPVPSGWGKITWNGAFLTVS